MQKLEESGKPGFSSSVEVGIKPDMLGKHLPMMHGLRCHLHGWDEAGAKWKL